MEKKEIMFSIVVILYNSERYIDKCVESILTQSESDFELILVDDGSTDGTLEKCRHYEKRDLRVKVVHKQNGGISSARNAGILEACGEFIIFVDGDDWLDIKYLEEMKKLIQKDPKVDCVLGRMMEHVETSGKERLVGDYFGEEINTILSHADSGKSSSLALFKRYGYFPMGMGARGAYRLSMLLEHDIVFWGKYYEDIDFTMKVMCYSRQVRCICNAYYFFRNHKNSTSKKSSLVYVKDIIELLNNWNNMCDEEDNEEFKVALMKEVGRRYGNMVAKYSKKLPSSELDEFIDIVKENQYLLKEGKNGVCRMIKLGFHVFGVSNTIRLYRKIKESR